VLSGGTTPEADPEDLDGVLALGAGWRQATGAGTKALAQLQGSMPLPVIQGAGTSAVIGLQRPKARAHQPGVATP